MSLVALTTALVFASLTTACSSDESSSGNSDPAGSCTDLCSKSGFSGSRVDNQPNEINCFCTGGNGTVTAALCTNMCTALKKGKSQPFKSGTGAMDACQCS